MNDHGQKIEASDVSELQILITAAEAYPAMERAFLDAKTEIWAGFRVFDLFTKLRSDEGRAIGETWFDLIVHVLEKGVSIHFVLSDFDPILAPNLHCSSWKARRAFIAAGELAGPEASLHVVNATHSARVGVLPSLLMWPAVIRRIARHARNLNKMPAEKRAKQLTCMPGLRAVLNEEPGGRLKSRKWPPPELVPGSHHQKITVIDRDCLFIGGLDLDERRYDDLGHNRKRDETWHDVQLMCRGKVVEAAQCHLEGFLDVVRGTRTAAGPSRLLRTLSRQRRVQFPFIGPHPLIDELSQAHIHAIRLARKLIYIETQFFRDKQIANELAKAAARHSDLHLILVLPGAPEDVAFDGATTSDARYGEYLQAKCVRRVQKAFGQRVAILSPVKPQPIAGRGRDVLCGSPIIYVHAKVAIFDDARAIVSSANLNGRSLRWDTEAGIEIDQPDHVRDLRSRVFRHWQGRNTADPFFDLHSAAGAWKARAESNATAAPTAREGFLVPYDVRPAEAFGYPVPGIPHEMV